MRKIFIPVMMINASLSTFVYAQEYVTGHTHTTVYSTQVTPQAPPQHYHKKHNDFSFSVTLPSQKTYFINNHGIRPKQANISWINVHAGQPLPHQAVVSGWERQGVQYACRVNYNGIQPGKLYQGQCIIGYGGRQIPFNHYEILVSQVNLHWIPGRFGTIPRNALQGGEEGGKPLYICQAEYHGGTHSGKVVGQNCNFAWGDGEVTVPYYKVLVV